MTTIENITSRNPLYDQELLNEIRYEFNLNCDVDYLFNRMLWCLNKPYTLETLSKLLQGLDETSITYVKSFMLKVILKNHPRYKALVKLYAKTILSYILPKDDFEKVRHPQNVFFTKDFMARQQKYNLEALYSLVAKDAGIGFLPQHIIQNIAQGNIIDGGSFNGETTLVFSDFTPHKVYTFEPIQKHIAMMKDKITSYNKQDQIEIVEYGISDTNASFSMNNETCSTAATFKNLEKSISADPGSYLAYVTSIDNFVQKYNINKISLIKLDIEGLEQKAIRGMQNVLKRDKPILLISIYHSLDDFFLIKTILEDMNLGYQFNIRHIEPVMCDHINEDVLYSYEYMLFAY